MAKRFPELTVPPPKESSDSALNASSLESGGSLGLSDLGCGFICRLRLLVREFELELWFDAVESPKRLFCGRAGWEGVVEMKPVDFYRSEDRFWT